MGNTMLKERRLGNRKKLTGLLPGRLQTLDGNDLDCKPVDISPFGMGIIVNQEFEIGTKIQLVMKGAIIDMTVAWVTPDFGKSDLYRHGLTTENQNLNLSDIFLREGCLK